MQPFLRGHVFLCIPISVPQKRNNTEGINSKSNIICYQNDGITNQHNMVSGACVRQSFHIGKMDFMYYSGLLKTTLSAIQLQHQIVSSFSTNRMLMKYANAKTDAAKHLFLDTTTLRRYIHLWMASASLERCSLNI